ncbi:carbonic anhydrase family protein [Pelagicoccus albus]|uniref:Carbonic anhydrase n=1 Tax=Pelagicoccus albus TaxID=415222 RepID=A0A7X1B788_9BACT|nr:carbonic anhydrase family protein [Pelagicoccus albus]MBC2606955.1 carbonic anhydrase [Pelagicoccus albus]
MRQTSILAIAASLVCATLTFADDHATENKNLPVTKAEQDALNPDKVLEDLKEGNERYKNGNHTDLNTKARVKAAQKGQFPKAYVLSCVDSRVPVESIFDQGIGDIFVGRVAGNVENEDQLGSMEYAAAAAGVKLIVVMGHESCGAVKGACDDVRLGNLTLLIEKIAPAVNSVEGYEEQEMSSKNKSFVSEVVHTNVERTVQDIRDRSPLLANMELEGKIKIIGAYYSLKDGSVTFME